MHGTTHTAAKGSRIFADESLCDIIRACSDSGVRKLKFSDIEIEFKDYSQPQVIQPIQAMDQVSTSYPTYTQATQASGQHTCQTQPFDRDLLEDLRTSQLLIDDPHGFEQEQITAQMKGVLNEAVQN